MKRLRTDQKPATWIEQLRDALRKLESPEAPQVRLTAIDDDSLVAMTVTLAAITFPDGMCIGYVGDQLVNIHVSDDDVIIVLTDEEESL